MSQLGETVDPATALSAASYAMLYAAAGPDRPSMPSELKTSEPAWGAGPARPQLAERAVHVWRADLAAAGEAQLDDLVSDEERERAAQLLSPERRRMWIRSRAILRALLARYLSGDPRELRFAAGAHGKPALAGDGPGERTTGGGDHSPGPHPPAGGTLFFNVSHSGPIALYALSAACEVGVDVERERERSAAGERRLAARLLGAERAQALDGLAPELRRRELLGAWTRYEAELKCRGTGIGEGLPLGAVAEPRCWVATLELGRDLAAAVAAAKGPAELCCWSWIA